MVNFVYFNSEQYVMTKSELGLAETIFTKEYAQGEIVSLTLSQREREVVLLAVEGLTTGEMARSLQVSPSTIKAHLLKIYRKLGIKRRIQLVKFAKAL
jgi:DNA-binding CsgD family transcriptional regulator